MTGPWRAEIRGRSPAMLGFHDDFAALRRYLVDEQFLARESGFYWRCDRQTG